MKRLIRKSTYVARGELEKLIGYFIKKKTGIHLNKEQFNEIKKNFIENGGSISDIKNKKEKNNHYIKLQKSIDSFLKNNN